MCECEGTDFSLVLTIVQAHQIVKVMTGAAADPDVVLLRDGILLGYDALSSLLVELDAATEILLGSQT